MANPSLMEEVAAEGSATWMNEHSSVSAITGCRRLFADQHNNIIYNILANANKKNRHRSRIDLDSRLLFFAAFTGFCCKRHFYWRITNALAIKKWHSRDAAYTELARIDTSRTCREQGLRSKFFYHRAKKASNPIWIISNDIFTFQLAQFKLEILEAVLVKSN